MAYFDGVKNQKGGGFLKLLLLAAVLIGGGYYALQYFGILGGKAPAPAASAPGTLNGGQPVAGSPAGEAVQGAEAAGELMGSGR